MNRTSNTRSASSGSPYLKPKLMSWIASRSGSGESARWANTFSRSSRNGEVARVDDDVRLVADRLEPATLLGDRAGDPALVGERVAVARLREAPDEDLVARLEEEHLRPEPAALERAAHRRQGHDRVAGPHVEDDRGLLEPLAILRDELRQLGQELARQVVDADVAEVLEQLRGRGLARPGQPAQDHDVLAGRRLGGGSRVGRVEGSGATHRAKSTPWLRRGPASGQLARASDEPGGRLEQDVHRQPEHERAHEVAARRRDRGEDRDPEDDVAARGAQPL